jgi:hypothetical protein
MSEAARIICPQCAVIEAALCGVCGEHCEDQARADAEEEDDDEDETEGDDLCDLCFTSGVNASRTTFCGKTIGIECGCNVSPDDGTCSNPGCAACVSHKQR